MQDQLKDLELVLLLDELGALHAVVPSSFDLLQPLVLRAAEGLRSLDQKGLVDVYQLQSRLENVH